MNEPPECLLPNAIHALLGGITPSTSKVLDAVFNAVMLRELHQYLPQLEQ